MDIALLVKVLAPVLPMLLGLVQKAVEKGSEKLGEKGAEGLAAKIWQLLQPKVEQNVVALDVARDVAKAPESKGATVSLEYQLKKILEAPENADLAAEVAKLLAENEDVKRGKFNMTVGDHAIIGAIGDRSTVTQNIGTKP